MLKLPSPVRAPISMGSEDFYVQSIYLFIFIIVVFICIFTPTPSCLPRQQLFCKDSSALNQSQKKISSEAENQLLSITAPALESNVHEKGITGNSLRYSRSKTLFEIEVY